MRKRYWLLTILIFCLGIAFGVFGHMYWGTAFHPSGVNQPAEKENAAKVGIMDGTAPPSSLLPDASAGSSDASISDLNKENTGQNQEETQITLSKTEQDKVVADYKQALGTLFDAWKAKDMDTFRAKIASAYTGEIMENHIKQAEKFIPEGMGLTVSDIKFDYVAIESADQYSATVNAIYRYTARDYDLNEEDPVGEAFNHFVHVRANLVKIDSRWLITGETAI
jgi:predicted lipid-binding transport protein (Tim44 family)